MAEGRFLAIVTGASTGIGYELARCCAQNGFDLVIAADEPKIMEASLELQKLGARVEAVEADLAALDGVDKLYAAAKRMNRPVDSLLANAGRGLGKAFLDQDFAEVTRVVDTNITGTLDLLQKVGRDMRARGAGRILITGSIAGVMPGPIRRPITARRRSSAHFRSHSLTSSRIPGLPSHVSCRAPLRPSSLNAPTCSTARSARQRKMTPPTLPDRASSDDARRRSGGHRLAQ
ncbi:MAG: SDR family NAD(P)-dependent oxidoreductase [Acetobacteraceae bacterium]|nr:SDR family NAD(P)-dependent oxidoreductase [Acetobacteraceae bacterium]